MGRRPYVPRYCKVTEYEAVSSRPLPVKTSVPDSMLPRYPELLIHPRGTRSLAKSRMFSETLLRAATRGRVRDDVEPQVLGGILGRGAVPSDLKVPIPEQRLSHGRAHQLTIGQPRRAPNPADTGEIIVAPHMECSNEDVQVWGDGPLRVRRARHKDPVRTDDALDLPDGVTTAAEVQRRARTDRQPREFAAAGFKIGLGEVRTGR